jgi:hypothetical protein
MDDNATPMHQNNAGHHAGADRMEAPELVGQNIPKAADINVGYLLGMVGWRTWKILRLGMKQRKEPRRLRFKSTSKPLPERQKGH